VDELKLATHLCTLDVGDTKCMLGTWQAKRINTRDF